MFQRWPKRDPERDFFMVPNEVFCLGLNYGEIARLHLPAPVRGPGDLPVLPQLPHHR